MTITAAVLVIISAFIHAGWNLFSKSQSPTVGFFMLATTGTIVCFSPIVFPAAELMASMPPVLWGILVVAGLFQAVYYTGLAYAYARGSLSIAYPLARSFPLLIIVAISFAAGRGDELSAPAILGISAIVAGAVILPMNAIGDFKLDNYLNASCAFALVAAAGTAGYSYVDEAGMKLLTAVPGDAAGWVRAALYLVLECFFTTLWLAGIMLMTREFTGHFRTNWRRLLRPAFMAGFAIGVTYCMVLLAMTYARNVSYIVALRQLSIPLGTVLGILVLRERGSFMRFFGVGVLFIGLVLVSLG